MKPTTYRVYLGTDEIELMRTVCEKTELGQSELLSKIVLAGLRAIKENDYRLTLPFRFHVTELNGKGKK